MTAETEARLRALERIRDRHAPALAAWQGWRATVGGARDPRPYAGVRRMRGRLLAGGDLTVRERMAVGLTRDRDLREWANALGNLGRRRVTAGVMPTASVGPGPVATPPPLPGRLFAFGVWRT
jgi:hypothetical protein